SWASCLFHQLCCVVPGGGVAGLASMDVVVSANLYRRDVAGVCWVGSHLSGSWRENVASVVCLGCVYVIEHDCQRRTCSCPSARNSVASLHWGLDRRDGSDRDFCCHGAPITGCDSRYELS